MKRTLLGLAIIGLSSSAFATNLHPTGFYIGGKVGGSIVHPEKIKHANAELGSYNKEVLAGGLAAGYDFSYDYDVPLRTEVDFTIRTKAKQDINKDDKVIPAKTVANTLFANVYYDIYTGTAFTPYLTAGAGVGFNKLEFEDSASTDKKQTKFAWTIGFGSSYSLTNALSADLSVRFVEAGKIKGEENQDSATIVATDVFLGLRYAF